MKQLIIFLILSCVILPCRWVFAEEEKAKCLESIEVLAGFSAGELANGQRNYMMAPLSVAFDFDLRGLTKKINFNPRQLLQFQIEPFLGLITSPRNNFETGVTFWLKMGFVPDSWKFQPYGKLGAGLDYMTLHTNEQSTQFNFIEQGALGLHYYFTENTAFTLEGRIRHLSNCGIKQPNHGFNSYSLVTGVSYKF